MKTLCQRLGIATLLTATLLTARGGQLFFDGYDDYVSVPDAAALDFTTSFTVETWVRFHQVNRAGGGYDWQCLFSKIPSRSNSQLAVHISPLSSK